MTETTNRNIYQSIALFATPLFALIFIFSVDLKPGSPQITAAAAVAIWMAIWWVTEAVPLAVTALLPLVLFPTLGVMNGKAVSSAYVNHIIFLFIGGFLVALAMEKWELHRRIALRTLLMFGRSPGSILMGFMVTTAVLSMWISNTATAMMMVPVAMAVVTSIEKQLGTEKSRLLSIGFLLAIAYSASIGGVATLIGTPPNLSFARILQISFEHAPEISFASWMIFALPLCVIMLGAAWVVIYLFFIAKAGNNAFSKGGLDKAYFRQEYLALGKTTWEQKLVGVAFVSMAILWIFRADIRLGGLIIPGWSNLFGNPKFINDGTVAIAVALFLFLLPSRTPGQRLLSADVFNKLPWDIVLLFGGGFALASGFIHSGLSIHIAEQMQQLDQLSPLLIIGCLCLLITFLTELTSNTATTEMFLPVLAAMSVAFGVNPLLLMIPATISASFAFMLPVATPPNAIVFGTRRLRVADMSRTGVFINFFGVLLVTMACYYWAPIAFDFARETLPDWAVLSSAKH